MLSTPRRATAFPRSIELGADQLVAVVGTHHRFADRAELTPEGFAETDYVTYSTTPEDGFEFEEFFGPGGVVPTTITRVESVSAVAEFIATTHRITILCHKAVPKRRGLRSLPLTPPPRRPAWTMTVTDTSLSPLVEGTIALIAAHWSR